jgi:hypothetical protein
LPDGAHLVAAIIVGDGYESERPLQLASLPFTLLYAAKVFDGLLLDSLDFGMIDDLAVLPPWNCHGTLPSVLRIRRPLASGVWKRLVGMRMAAL